MHDTVAFPLRIDFCSATERKSIQPNVPEMADTGSTVAIRRL
jgi:hypothetical protein